MNAPQAQAKSPRARVDLNTAFRFDLCKPSPKPGLAPGRFSFAEQRQVLVPGFFRLLMTRRAQRNQVIRVIGAVDRIERSERNHVMHIQLPPKRLLGHVARSTTKPIPLPNLFRNGSPIASPAFTPGFDIHLHPMVVPPSPAATIGAEVQLKAFLLEPSWHARALTTMRARHTNRVGLRGFGPGPKIECGLVV